jgi:hypothetical protein
MTTDQVIIGLPLLGALMIILFVQWIVPHDDK